MKTISLILADDHRLVRDGIKSLLNNLPDIHILAEAENGEEACKLADKHKPMIMLLDISMPVMNGLEAIKIIKNLAPKTKSIMLSMHDEPEYAIKSLKSGASGYLLKNIEREELVQAIRTVAEGKTYFQGEVAQSVMKQFMQESNSLARPSSVTPDTLTDREKEILQLVADGLSTKQIAKKLFISPRTVEAHRSNLIKKTGAQNAAELIKLATQYGLLPAPNSST